MTGEIKTPLFKEALKKLKRVKVCSTHVSSWILWCIAFETPIDDKAITVTMGDRTEWVVPVWLVAADRAKAYAYKHGDNVLYSYINGTVPLFERSPHVAEMWAQDEMTWMDVKMYAKRVSEPQEVDYQDGWKNGPMLTTKWW